MGASIAVSRSPITRSTILGLTQTPALGNEEPGAALARLGAERMV